MRFNVLLLTALIFTAFAMGCSKPADPQNASEMKEKLASKVKLALWKVNASDAQKQKMDTMLNGLARDLFAFQQEDKAIKRSIMAALNEEPVDRAALEALQQKGLQLFDRYTKRMLAAGVDASEILDLKQRRELLKLWREYEFDE